MNKEKANFFFEEVASNTKYQLLNKKNIYKVSYMSGQCAKYM